MLKNNGITLVSLVITILVLLILSTVAINLAVSQNGLFEKAENTVARWNNKVDEESEIARYYLDKFEELNGDRKRRQ